MTPKSSGAGALRSVLVVHNSYRSTVISGEDLVAAQEIELLREHGVVVDQYTKSNDALCSAGVGRLVCAAVQTPWSWSARREFASILEKHRPDVVHIHNTFPLISYSVVDVCSSKNIPCVVTLHNCRWICSNGLFLRDGAVCTECLEHCSPYPALRHRCYRNSLVATVPVAAMIALNNARELLVKRVSAVIVLTEFQKAQLHRLHVPCDKLFVKPNFVRSAGVIRQLEDRDLDFLFVGRLSQEKGVSVLLDAWRLMGGGAPRLTVVGDGPLRSALLATSPENVAFVGPCSREGVLEYMRRARALLFPSTSFEGFPLVLAEALSLGVPTLASRIGGIPEIVREGLNGQLVAPGSPVAWAEAIQHWTRDPERARIMGQNARNLYERLYTPERNLDQLLRIYRFAQMQEVDTARPRAALIPES